MDSFKKCLCCSDNVYQTLVRLFYEDPKTLYYTKKLCFDLQNSPKTFYEFCLHLNDFINKLFNNENDDYICHLYTDGLDRNCKHYTFKHTNGDTYLKTRAVKKLMCATCYTFHLETVLQYKSLFQQNIVLMNSLKECVLQLSVKKNKRYHEICHMWKGIDHYYQRLFDEPYPVC